MRCLADGARLLLALYSIQFEQIDRVEPPDLEPVGVADAGPVEPICRVIDVLEWPVGREKDAIGADLEDRINQLLRSEITRSREVEVGVEIIRDLSFSRVFRPRLHPGIAVVDAPHAVRQPFAEMAKDDEKLRIFVEQAGAHEPQCVDGRFLSEGPGRPEQPIMAFVDLRPPGERIARMQIERYVELFDDAPERPVLR